MIAKNWFRFATLTLVLCILVVNGILIRQNNSLKRQLDLVIHKEFHPGDVLRSFGGVEVSGRYATVGFKNEPKSSLIIAFSTGCTACKANLANWLALSRQLDRSQWRVIWVSRDSNSMTKDFIHSNGITDQVISDFSCSNYDYLGLRMVPRMVVVGRDGKIKRIWNGALVSEEWAEVFKYFNAPSFSLASRR